MQGCARRVAHLDEMRRVAFCHVEGDETIRMADGDRLGLGAFEFSSKRSVGRRIGIDTCAHNWRESIDAALPLGTGYAAPSGRHRSESRRQESPTMRRRCASCRLRRRWRLCNDRPRRIASCPAPDRTRCQTHMLRNGGSRRTRLRRRWDRRSGSHKSSLGVRRVGVAARALLGRAADPRNAAPPSLGIGSAIGPDGPVCVAGFPDVGPLTHAGV